ncbi:MAG: DNA adenine methylase [Chloroflexi bacterium]|nr:DNA adenine methylase [Chloroflexota bacterium]
MTTVDWGQEQIFSEKTSNRGLAIKPFLKWAGGKQQLLTQFDPYFPPNFSRYFEPFLGGGAIFFHLVNTARLPEQIYLSDNNEELINAYTVVRDQVEALIKQLVQHQEKHNKDYYYQVRSWDRTGRQLNDVERAARTIYLNRTCYNGLYRVNQKGQFNVPLGSYKNPQIVRPQTLRVASTALQGVTLQTRNFHKIVDVAQVGDFFYFDPPYDPVSKTANFTSYTAVTFTEEDQERLADVFAQLSAKGCYCMLSNSHTSFICRLYQDFRIETVLANRAINSKGNGRGRIKEVVILNA